jgi:hypothetical protein
VRLVSEKIETNPLDWMKKNQTTNKTKVIYNRNGIGYKLFHGVKNDGKVTE